MKNLFILTLLMGLPLSSHAEFIHTDWQTEGDEAATLDTQTGLEWLKLENTANYSYNTAIQGIQDGTLTGWRLPSNNEIETLQKHFFTTAENLYANYFTSADASEIEQFKTYMGGDSGNVEISSGFYLTEDGVIQVAGSKGDFSKVIGLESNWSYNENDQWSSRGVYLVSDGGTTLTSQQDPSINQVGTATDVGLPAGISLAALSLFGLTFRRRQHV